MPFIRYLEIAMETVLTLELNLLHIVVWLLLFLPPADTAALKVVPTLTNCEHLVDIWLGRTVLFSPDAASRYTQERCNSNSQKKKKKKMIPRLTTQDIPEWSSRLPLGVRKTQISHNTLAFCESCAFVHFLPCNPTYRGSAIGLPLRMSVLETTHHPHISQSVFE